MSEDFMIETPAAFELEERGLVRPDTVSVGNAQNDDRPRPPLGVALTGYRLLATSVIMGFGIPKAVYAYRGHPLVSPTLDLVGGVLLGLLLLWLGVIEATRPESCPSFFQVDLASAILLASRLRHRNSDTSPLDPETQEIPRRGDTSPASPLAPDILGVLSNDNSPPLIPGISGVLDRDDTSPPLEPATLESLRRDNTLPLAPPTLPVGPVCRASSPMGHQMDFIFDPITVPGNDEMLTAMQAIQNPSWLENMLMPGFSWPAEGPASSDTSPLDLETQEIPRRGDTSPLSPEILEVLSNDNTPPLDPAVLGSLRRDNTLPLAPPTLQDGPLRRGDTSSPLGQEMDFVFDPITVPGNDETFTAMQAVQSPNWLENMLMPGFHWPAEEPMQDYSGSMKNDMIRKT